MSYRIFLSHSEKDAELVTAIRDAARSADVELYAFEDDVQPGSPLRKKVLDALQSSDAVVAVLTQNGASSPTVQHEIGAALQQRKQVIPIYGEDVDTRRFPFLAELEYLKISTAEPEESIEKLSLRLGVLKNKKELVAFVALLVLVALGIYIMTREG